MITRYDDYGHEYTVTWWEANKAIVGFVALMVVFAAMVLTVAITELETAEPVPTCTCCSCMQDSTH